LLDQKVPKNQENPNGLPACNAPSADFHPPRAGKVSVNNRGRIFDGSEFESGLIVVINGAFGDQLVYQKGNCRPKMFCLTHIE